jgi:hypothetical protein
MGNKKPLDEKPDQHQCYEIRLEGYLDDQWSDWFDGLTISLEKDGDTLLTGPVLDQAALHGLLRKVRDLGLTLVSVSPVEQCKEDMSDTKQQIGAGGLFTPKPITYKEISMD